MTISDGCLIKMNYSIHCIIPTITTTTTTTTATSNTSTTSTMSNINNNINNNNSNNNSLQNRRKSVQQPLQQPSSQRVVLIEQQDNVRFVFGTGEFSALIEDCIHEMNHMSNYGSTPNNNNNNNNNTKNNNNNNSYNNSYGMVEDASEQFHHGNSNSDIDNLVMMLFHVNVNQVFHPSHIDSCYHHSDALKQLLTTMDYKSLSSSSSLAENCIGENIATKLQFEIVIQLHSVESEEEQWWKFMMISPTTTSVHHHHPAPRLHCFEMVRGVIQVKQKEAKAFTLEQRYDLAIKCLERSFDLLESVCESDQVSYFGADSDNDDDDSSDDNNDSDGGGGKARLVNVNKKGDGKWRQELNQLAISLLFDLANSYHLNGSSLHNSHKKKSQHRNSITSINRGSSSGGSSHSGSHSNNNNNNNGSGNNGDGSANVQKAIETTDLILRIDPCNVEALILRSHFHQLRNDMKSAMEGYIRAMDICQDAQVRSMIQNNIQTITNCLAKYHVEIVGTRSEGDTTYYQIHLVNQLAGIDFYFYSRYSTMKKLYDQLARKVPKMSQVVSFPQGSWFRSNSTSVINDRKEKLNQFLKYLLTNHVAGQHEEVRQFFIQK